MSRRALPRLWRASSMTVATFGGRGNLLMVESWASSCSTCRHPTRARLCSHPRCLLLAACQGAQVSGLDPPSACRHDQARRTHIRTRERQEEAAASGRAQAAGVPSRGRGRPRWRPGAWPAMAKGRASGQRVEVPLDGFPKVRSLARVRSSAMPELRFARHSTAIMCGAVPGAGSWLKP